MTLDYNGKRKRKPFECMCEAMPKGQKCYVCEMEDEIH